jgi:hypothetical protein
MKHTYYSVTNKKTTLQSFMVEATSEVIYAFYVTVAVISLMNGKQNSIDSNILVIDVTTFIQFFSYFSNNARGSLLDNVFVMFNVLISSSCTHLTYIYIYIYNFHSLNAQRLCPSRIL